MSSQSSPVVETQPRADEAWIPSLARGLVALALGLVITFSPDHSAAFGVLAFGVFALATAAVQFAARHGYLAAVVSLIAGVVALALPLAAELLLVVVVSAWAVVSGGLELIAAVRARRRGAPARDALTSGVLLLALAVAVLVIPPDYVQPWAVTDRDGAVEATGAVTASIMIVGVIGAWAVIHGVLTVIAAISRRPSVPTAPAVASEDER